MLDKNKLQARKDSTLLTLLIALIVSLSIWMYIAKLDIVSSTVGSVVPSSQIKIIQHLEGGIVRKIYVEEGQKVVANQPLVELESTDSEANVGEMLVRLATLTVQVARLEAESIGSEVISFTAEVEEKTPKLAQQEKALFEARRDRYLSEIASRQGLVSQKEQVVRLFLDG